MTPPVRYPAAAWAPWLYQGASGEPSYYAGPNKPVAVVLHVMQGHMATVLGWARSGYPHASWHFSVGREGLVYQHLALTDGGYQAGIARERRDAGGRVFGYNPEPTWPLWRGWGENVNHYTIGVEHEGFSGEPFTAAQSAASRKLCRWIATELGIPYDRDHFPPHADIALIDRPSDFNTPALREAHYQFMFEEEGDEMGMTTEERAYVDALRDAVYGQAYVIDVLTKQLHDEQAKMALITQAPATALAPDGHPWNLFERIEKIRVMWESIIAAYKDRIDALDE